MKRKKQWQMLALLVVVIFVATGCVSYDSAGNPSGAVFEYFGKPAIALLDMLANFFGGSYGIAIILVTLLTRVFMLPSSLKMTKSSMISQARMKVAQPEIDEIRAEIEAATDPAVKNELNAELMAVYKKYDIDMFGGLTGCLPLLIQMPIISAVYAAIRSSQPIANSEFLGIHLGSKSVLIVALVVAATAFQGWLMQKQMPASDNPTAQQTTRTMMLVNPLMLGWFTWVSAAGLGVYFLTGAVFQIFQQLYTNNVVRPKIAEILAQEAKDVPERPARQRKVSPEQSADKPRLIPTKEALQTAPTQRRNEGKQKRS